MKNFFKKNSATTLNEFEKSRKEEGGKNLS